LVNPGPDDPGLKSGLVEKKTREEKTWCDPATRLTRKNPVKTQLQTR
jgi:hypothetical protein